MRIARLLLLTLASIAVVQTASAQQKLKPIPDDFDARNTILLIEDAGDERRSDMMEEVMQTEYPYKYKIVPFKDVRGIRNDTAYAGKPQYRYIIGNSEKEMRNPDPNATFRTYGTEVYYIHDMREKVTYPAMPSRMGAHSGTFRSNINALVRHMQKQN
ncbi:MAG: hypothetical protein JST76_07760 [Bacteroidetes bacterium]|nr:hypothetical protein [Bacteroidota bacterium]